jgi:hypothetical protein
MKKKQSQVSKIIALLQDNPNTSAKEMADKLKMPLNRIYVLRNQAKKKLNGSQPTTPKVTTDSYIKNLEAENIKLTEWTKLWKQKYDQLNADYAQAKIMFLNSEAVVSYLERKVLELLRNDG